MLANGGGGGDEDGSEIYRSIRRCIMTRVWVNESHFIGITCVCVRARTSSWTSSYVNIYARLCFVNRLNDSSWFLETRCNLLCMQSLVSHMYDYK